MIIILCVDDNNGTLFNHRRQSKDKKLREKITEILKGEKLWMNAYTYEQFKETDLNDVLVDDDFLEKAAPGQYCFVENIEIKTDLNNVEKIILFKWNRSYSADSYFTVDLNNWKKIEIEEFSGSSHQKITKEVYIR